MNFRTSIVSAGLAGSLLLAPCATPAYAVTQSDVDAASAKLAELGDQLSGIQSDLEAATQDVEETSYRIGEKSSQVEAAQADLAQKKTSSPGLCAPTTSRVRAPCSTTSSAPQASRTS